MKPIKQHFSQGEIRQIADCYSHFLLKSTPFFISQKGAEKSVFLRLHWVGVVTS